MTITARGYNPVVATVEPVRGQTNNDGELEVTVRCHGLSCPDDTVVTFTATGYGPAELTVNCRTLPKEGMVTAYVPVEVPRQLLAGLFQGDLMGAGRAVEPPEHAQRRGE